MRIYVYVFVYPYSIVYAYACDGTRGTGRADRRMESLPWSLAPDENPPVFLFLLVVFPRMIEEPYVKVANAYAQQHNYLNENPVVFLRTDIASAS